MCGPDAPRVQERDIEAEQRTAERKATREANAELAYRRSRRRGSSLIANPGGAAGLYGNPGSAIAQQPTGKDTLG